MSKKQLGKEDWVEWEFALALGDKVLVKEGEKVLRGGVLWKGKEGEFLAPVSLKIERIGTDKLLVAFRAFEVEARELVGGEIFGVWQREIFWGGEFGWTDWYRALACNRRGLVFFGDEMPDFSFSREEGLVAVLVENQRRSGLASVLELMKEPVIFLRSGPKKASLFLTE